MFFSKPKYVYSLLFVVLNIILQSCNYTSTKQMVKKKPFEYAITDKEFGYLNDYNDPDKLIALLDNSNPLEDRYFGFSSEYKSASFPIYRRLCYVADDTTLLRLSYHTNPKIRVYAMWALTEKNKQLALQRMKELKNYDSGIIYMSDCLTTPEPANFLMASHFDSTEVLIKYKTVEGAFRCDVVVR